MPKKSFIFLAGTTLDYSDGLNGKGFVFSNPNAKKSCGCQNFFRSLMTLKYFYKSDVFSFYSLSGKDSIDLINRLSTNNISDVDNKITKTIFTNENGRIIDVVSIWKINDEKLLLICNTMKIKIF